jgi:midasin (ATPase involved in ribosome maturation)
MLVLSTSVPIIVTTNDLAVARSHLRIMARCQNQVLNRIVLNPRSDTSQLLGCFEQVSGSDSEKSRFEWVDSLLIKAMLEGGWVLVEGAHLTSAAVLDRLNGVLEDQGEFVVNE